MNWIIVYKDRRGNRHERYVDYDVRCRHLIRLLKNQCKILRMEKVK